MIAWRVDSLIPVVRMLRRVKIHDPYYHGELINAASYSQRKSFFARRGKSVDEISELIWDGGYTASRPEINDTLDFIESVFRTLSCASICHSADRDSKCYCRCGGRNHGMDT